MASIEGILVKEEHHWTGHVKKKSVSPNKTLISGAQHRKSPKNLLDAQSECRNTQKSHKVSTHPGTQYCHHHQQVKSLVLRQEKPRTATEPWAAAQRGVGDRSRAQAGTGDCKQLSHGHIKKCRPGAGQGWVQEGHRRQNQRLKHGKATAWDKFRHSSAADHEGSSSALKASLVNKERAKM